MGDWLRAELESCAKVRGGPAKPLGGGQRRLLGSRTPAAPRFPVVRLIIVAVGMPFVISYTAVIYWVFRAKFQRGDVVSHPGTAEPTPNWRTDMKRDSACKHVIIVGGGFAGLA